MKVSKADSSAVDFIPDDIVIMSTEYFNYETCGSDMRFRLAGETFGMKAASSGSCCIGYWMVDGEHCRVERYQIDFAKTNNLWDRHGRETLRNVTGASASA
tara:strand:+ start:49 stop:351 length:303 start_codon:yes stop_codon:yes gene_type:complete